MISVAISLSLFASFRGNYPGLMLFWSVMCDNISCIHFLGNLPGSNKRNNNNATSFFLTPPAPHRLSRGTKMHIEHMVRAGRLN